VEHGGWGFLLEPILAGLLVAPSWAGFWLALAAVAVFLLHQPLKVALKDWRSRRSYVRTRWAWRFALLYAGVALLSFGLGLAHVASPVFLPLLLAVLLSAVQFFYEARNRGRELIPEVFGALALAAAAPVILLAGGQSLTQALALWVLLGLRVVTSLMYVRTKLRYLRGKAASRWPTVAAHLAALVAAAGLVWGGVVSAWLVVALLLLTGRAVYSLYYATGAVRPKIIGFQELAFGVAYVVLVAASLR
jgi:hypothetical protein